MTTTAVINYGSGNIFSLTNALDHVGVKNILITSPDDLAAFDQVVVPGVGAYSSCMDKLRDTGFDKAIKDYVGTGRKTLGICVGMQVLFDRSFEFGDHLGLGFLPGVVDKIPSQNAAGDPVTVPHIGWQKISISIGTDQQGSVAKVLTELDSDQDYYFVHSYTAKPDVEGDLLAVADYSGISIAAAAGRGNLLGLQFHPEKSGEAGLELLKQWAAF